MGRGRPPGCRRTGDDLGEDLPNLRIHFTGADFGRTRLKMETDLMWEVVGSVQVLQHGEGGVWFDWWRRYMRDLVARDSRVRAAVHALMEVAPHASYFPDFLTPTVDVPDLDTGIDVVLSTSPPQLREEMTLLRQVTRTTTWLDDISRGDIRALRQLRTALRTYVGEAIEPHRQAIEDALRIERADRVHTYLQYGSDGLLAGFEPLMSWCPPVLTADYPVDRDLHLDGRGLLLVPCYFSLQHPVALANPSMRPVLVLPIRPESRFEADCRGVGDELGALLGPTRARILRSALAGNTTAELAKLNNITPATVSHHTGVLRNAGLITTLRRTNCATHLITPLGLRLLDECRFTAARPGSSTTGVLSR